MSKELLIGIGIVGAGWVYIHERREEAIKAGLQDAAAKVGSKVSDIAGAVFGGLHNPFGSNDKTDDKTALGGDPVEGTQTGAPKVSTSGPAGEPGLVIDTTANSGGTDPSATPATFSSSDLMAAATEAGGRAADIAASVSSDPSSGDVQATWMQTLFGPSGSKGMTPSQISQAYALSGQYAGEVF